MGKRMQFAKVSETICQFSERNVSFSHNTFPIIAIKSLFSLYFLNSLLMTSRKKKTSISDAISYPLAVHVHLPMPIQIQSQNEMKWEFSMGAMVFENAGGVSCFCARRFKIYDFLTTLKGSPCSSSTTLFSLSSFWVGETK